MYNPNDARIDFNGGQYAIKPLDERIIEWFGLYKFDFSVLDGVPILALDIQVEILDKLPSESKSLNTLPPNGFYGYVVCRKQGRPIGEKIRLSFRGTNLQFAFPENLVSEWAWCYHTAQQDALRLINPLLSLAQTRAPVLPTLNFDEISVHLGSTYKARITASFIHFAEQCNPFGRPDLKPSSLHPEGLSTQPGYDSPPVLEPPENSPAYDGENDNGETYEPPEPNPSVEGSWNFNRRVFSNGTQVFVSEFTVPGIEGSPPVLKLGIPQGGTTYMGVTSNGIDYALGEEDQSGAITYTITDAVFTPIAPP
jgi:hypothetical protein